MGFESTEQLEWKLQEAERNIADLQALVATREAELADTHNRLVEIDKARVQGVKMCQDRDTEIAELEAALAKEQHLLEAGNAAIELANHRTQQAMAERNDLKKLVNQQADEIHELRYRLGLSPPLMSNRHDLDKIELDVLAFGTGFGRLRSDGRIEHIPAPEVVVHHRTAGNITQANWGQSLFDKLKRLDMALGIITMDPGAKEGDQTVERVFVNQTMSKFAIRGVDFACEECKEFKGSTFDDGWYRCNNCGYPGK